MRLRKLIVSFQGPSDPVINYMFIHAQLFRHSSFYLYLLRAIIFNDRCKHNILDLRQAFN